MLIIMDEMLIFNYQHHKKNQKYQRKDKCLKGETTSMTSATEKTNNAKKENTKLHVLQIPE